MTPSTRRKLAYRGSAAAALVAAVAGLWVWLDEDPPQSTPAPVPTVEDGSQVRPSTNVPAQTTTTVAGPPELAPEVDDVGPRKPMRDHPGGEVPCGEYSALRFAETVELEEGCAYRFTDVEVCFGATTFGRVVTVTNSFIRCAWWFDEGGHGGITIEWSHIVGNAVGVRPNGDAEGRIFTLRDSVVEARGPVGEGAHSEVLASWPGTTGILVERTRFLLEPRWDEAGNTPNTGIVNVSGTDVSFVDCVFGDESLEEPAHYMMYTSPEVSFIRPVIYPGRANYWYTAVSPNVIDPIYRE